MGLRKPTIVPFHAIPHLKEQYFVIFAFLQNNLSHHADLFIIYSSVLFKKCIANLQGRIMNIYIYETNDTSIS